MHDDTTDMDSREGLTRSSIRKRRLRVSASHQGVVTAIVICVAAVQFGLTLAAERGMVFDDAFITYRYAQNLATGHGLTWNPDEPPVEGYTNFLLVLILAPFINLGLDPLVVTRVLSVAAAAGLGIVLYLLAKNFGLSNRWFAALVAASFFLLTPSDRLCLVGLETVVFSFTLLLAFAIAVGEARRKERSWWLFGLITVLAFLLRPEAVFLPVAVVVSARMCHGKSAALRVCRDLVPSFVVPLTLYLLWKYIHFGTIVPNPFFLKVDTVTLLSVSGIRSVAEFAYDYRNLLILVIFSYFMTNGIRDSRFARAVAAVFALLYVLFFLRVDTLMDIYGRFLYPITTFMLFLALPTLAYVYETLTSWKAPAPRKVVVSTLVIILFFATTPFVRTLKNARDVVAGHDPYRTSEDLMQKELRVARALSAYPHIQDVCIAIGDAGVIPYYTGARHLDPVGLTDAFIARETDLDTLVDYFFDTSPDLVFWPAEKSHSWIAYGHGPMGDLTLYNTRPEWDRFTYVGTVTTAGTMYDLHLFLRNEFDEFPGLERFLTHHVVDGRYVPFPIPIGSYVPAPGRPPVWIPSGPWQF